MAVPEIKKAAYIAASADEINLDERIRDYSFADEMYFLSMLFFYKSFRLGAISKESGQAIEQRLSAKYDKLSTAYYFEKGHYDRMVAGFAEMGQLKSTLIQQMKVGDVNTITTLFKLLDFYTNDNIYAKLFLAMQSGALNDGALNKIIAECPEEYRRSMTLEECRAVVWDFIRVMNGEVQI